MNKSLHYQFERRSKNHLDWLINIIKSEKYFQSESRAFTAHGKSLYARKLHSA